jgi:hypothetical protein
MSWQQQCGQEQEQQDEEFLSRMGEKWPGVKTWPGRTKGNEMNVYKAINKVQAELSKTGISKDRTNTQGSGYKFRGIDDVYNAVAPLLATHGLCILPRMLTRICEERQSRSGGALFYVTVEAEFDFVCAEDGSMHTVKTFGEAMDSGDKATNKAMSAAYKYAAFQAFAIPTEGDNDADAQTHQVAPRLKHTPTDEVIRLSDARRMVIELAASIAVEKWKKDDQLGAFEEISGIEDPDEKTYLWQLLKPHSALRAFIKKTAQELREAATA